MVLASEVVGKEVIESKGFNIGKISDVQLDENDWKVLALEVLLNKDVAEEHHLRHRFRRTKVLISVDHIQGVGDKIILKGSKDEILKLIASSPMTGSAEIEPGNPTPEPVNNKPTA
jgi:sporulation protein YlmC with PRC-barrel domain